MCSFFAIIVSLISKNDTVRKSKLKKLATSIRKFEVKLKAWTEKKNQDGFCFNYNYFYNFKLKIKKKKTTDCLLLI